jgi:hypothetical protein
VRPSPVADLRHVDAVFVRVVAAFDLHIPHPFLDVRACDLQAWHAVNDIGHQAEAVNSLLMASSRAY